MILILHQPISLGATPSAYSTLHSTSNPHDGMFDTDKHTPQGTENILSVAFRRTQAIHRLGRRSVCLRDVVRSVLR
ncbi:hypothetical protein CPC08DRAFT_217373 [Agrocybe pediades]|nr:hypothetical protein CPC08DRAFT_217373 [Agrocybe pediades]